MALFYYFWMLLIHLDVVALFSAITAFLIFYKIRKQFLLKIGLIFLTLFSLLFVSPIGRWMITILENRIEAVDIEAIDRDSFDGFILLGSALYKEASASSDRYILAPTAGALFDAIALFRKFENKPIIFTGTPLEVKHAEHIFSTMGVDKSRLIFESSSKNTKDNAQNSYLLVNPNPSSRWLLITNAFHMPRSMGLFRKAGWNVKALPVNYLTTGKYDALSCLLGLDKQNLAAYCAATKELAGLFNHYIEGASDSLFPSDAD